MTEASRAAVPTLADFAHADGGWGYAPGQAPQIEPTCFALLALAVQDDGPRSRPLLSKGLAFLDRCALPNGRYRLANGREEAVWPTALALFTKLALARIPNLGAVEGGSGPTPEASAACLLGIQVKTPDSPEAGELHDIDLKLTGWPWADQNFSWVEPTAWSCLALAHLGLGDHPRVREGLAMLLDRAMDAGGINYGNRLILGRMTEPIPGPTALMLLALQNHHEADASGQRGRHPRVRAAVQYLLGEIDTADVDHLCWAKLALDLYQDEPGVAEALARLDALILDGLQTRERRPYLRPAILRLALAGLARATGRHNVFRLPAAASARAPAASTPGAFTPAKEILPLATAQKPSLGQRFGAWFRGLAVKAAGQLRPLPTFSGVHIARAASYDDDLAAILWRQYEHFRAHVPLKDKRVVLKPNLVEYHRDKVINTNPRVVAAAIALCKQEGAREIIVAEGPGHWRNVEYLVTESGLGDVLQEHGVPFVDLNHDEPVKTPNLGRLTGLEYLYLTKTIATADVVISLPKLKTHHWAGATLSLKNLFGTLPGICYGWPKNELHWRGIDNSIVDIALTRTPELAIVDGIVGMEGDGPLNGTAKPFGALVMGHDLVAVDATCCRLMMLDPERLGYLVLGHMKRLGRLKEAEVPQLGETIAALAQTFATVPHLDHVRLKHPA